MINVRAKRPFAMSAWFLLLWGLLPADGGILPGEIKDNKFKIMYLIPWSHEWSVGPNIGSAIQVAINAVKSQQILDGYDFEFTFRDTWCKSVHGVEMALDMWELMEDVDFVLGDGCSVVCEPTALLSSVWNIPQVSYGCAGETLSNKTVYPTFVRTVGPWKLLAPMFNAIADLWGHARVGIIAEPSDLMRNTAEHIKKRLEAHGKTVYYRVVETTVAGSVTILKNYKLLKDWVNFLKDKCRMILIITYGNDVRNTLIAAHELGMLDGNYLFTSLEVSPIVLSPPRDGWLYPELGPELFNGLLIGNPVQRTDPAYGQFQQDVIDAFQDPIWSGLPHLNSGEQDKVISYAALVYDSVLLWAHGANKTLEQGGNADDGVKMAQNMFDVEFEGMSGKVSLNKDGDRLLEFTIDIPQNGAIQSISKWVAGEGRLEKLYKPSEPNNWEGLIWGGNSSSPPKNHPPCGWDYEICLPGKLKLGAAIFFGAVAAIGILTLCGYNIWKFCKFRKNVQVNVEDFDMRLELKYMRDIASKNLNPFLGIVITSPNACILMGYASRGSIQDLLDNDNVLLTWELKLSLTNDICQGLAHIHNSNLMYHGHLTSANCLVDNRFVCKITDYGFHQLRSQATVEIDGEEYIRQKLWYAPELLRGGCRPSPETDIYAFAIICQEILLEGPPYCENEDGLTALEIIKNVEDYDLDPPYRPFIPDDKRLRFLKTGFIDLMYFLELPELLDDLGKTPDMAGYEWREMIKWCWQDYPSERASLKQIRKCIKSINGGEGLHIDNLIHVLYRHNRHVEKKVDDKYEGLENEKNKLNNLLMELLPKSVAEELKMVGSNVPEVFDSVTVCFAYNVDFTATCVQWSPNDIVQTLNRMYQALDEVMGKFDVYKVATVGDSLMVTSGLPNRNGTKHAEEICGMAEKFQEALTSLKFPHIPGKCMRLRCGVHTGSVVAGVAGVRVPRYLLFGNTVDYAAKMETSGEPERIHLSQATHQLLDKSVFKLDYRWELELKGFGRMKTYWLSKVNWENW